MPATDVGATEVDNQNLCPDLPGVGKIPSWKRFLDRTCILMSSPVTVPVFGLVALWVKAVSPGPVLFKQNRVGFGGRQFKIFKFRTMKINVETGFHEKHTQDLISADVPMTKLDVIGDPRIIKGGRILRALGLDELPQLVNVWRGEMSLVGPRPCLPCEWERLKDWQKARYNALPGLTGYWQVNGKNKTTFSQMIEMDIYYTKHQSLALDLKIMLKTFPVLFAQITRDRKAVPVVSTSPEAAPEVNPLIVTTPE